MATISPATLSNAFSWMKMLEFRLKFHWSLFLRVQLPTFQHWFREWLAPTRWQAIIWTDDCLDCRRIYASVVLNESISPFSAWLWDLDAAVRRISNRVALITGLSTTHRHVLSSAEPLQVSDVNSRLVPFPVPRVAAVAADTGPQHVVQSLSFSVVQNLF